MRYKAGDLVSSNVLDSPDDKCRLVQQKIQFMRSKNQLISISPCTNIPFWAISRQRPATVRGILFGASSKN